MSHSHFSFSTSAFDDSDDIAAQNVNGIVGHTLAGWLARELTARGMQASAVWDEDHGWDFWVSDEGEKFLCACSVIVDDGAPFEGHVSLEKQRTLADRLRGRNKPSPQDGMLVAVQSALNGSPDIENVELQL